MTEHTTKVPQWVQALTAMHFDLPPLEVGETVPHPDGRTVHIVDGQFWGKYGLSNFWYWREVLPDGSLSKTLEHGYGWRGW